MALQRSRNIPDPVTCACPSRETKKKIGRLGPWGLQLQLRRIWDGHSLEAATRLSLKSKRHYARRINSSTPHRTPPHAGAQGWTGLRHRQIKYQAARMRSQTDKSNGTGPCAGVTIRQLDRKPQPRCHQIHTGPIVFVPVAFVSGQ